MSSQPEKKVIRVSAVTYVPYFFNCRACGLPMWDEKSRKRAVCKVCSLVICKCGRVLSQPYAIEMGECVSCCLKRLRAGLGRGLMTRDTGWSARHRRAYQLEYNRNKRQQAEA